MTDEPSTRQPRAAWRPAEVQTLTAVMLINVVDGIDNQLLALSISAIGGAWRIDPAAFSAAISAGFLGAALGTPLGGYLGDRLGRKPVMLLGVALFGLMTMALGLSQTTGQLTLARLIGGIGLGACLPPMLALIVETVSADKRGTAVALTMVSMPLGLTLSGVVIPRLDALLGWRSSFVLCGAAVLGVALLALWLVREPVLPSHRTTTDSRWSRAISLSRLFRDVDLALFGALMVAIFLIYAAMAAALSWLPVFSQGQGIGQVAAGQSISFWSLAGMAGTLLAGQAINRLGPMRAARVVIASFAAAAFAASLALLALGTADATLYLGAGLGGLFASGAITVLYAAAADCIPQQARANAMAAVTLAGKLGGIAGGASGFIVLAMPSLTTFFGAIGMLSVLALLCLLIGGRKRPATDNVSLSL